MEIKAILISALCFTAICQANDKKEVQGKWSFKKTIENEGMRKEYISSSSLLYKNISISNKLGNILTPVGAYSFEKYSKFDPLNKSGWVPLIWNHTNKSFEKYRTFQERLIREGKLASLTTKNSSNTDLYIEQSSSKDWVKGNMDDFKSNSWLYSIKYGYWINPLKVNSFLEQAPWKGVRP